MGRLEIKEQAQEYLSCLVSVELAAMFARLYNEPISRNIKLTCQAVAARCEDSKVQGIFKGVGRQPFPVGAVCMMRRELDSCLGEPE